MRGMLNGIWHVLDEWHEASSFVGRPQLFVKDDPERGTFEQDDFEEFEP